MKNSKPPIGWNLIDFDQTPINGGIIENEEVWENFGESDIGTQFNLAMMTQINEIHSGRHLNMQFLEFAEAIARIADKVYSVKKDLHTQANSIQNTIKRTRTKDKKDKIVNRAGSEVILKVPAKR